MKKLAAVLVLVVLASMFAMGQDKASVFGGWQFTSIDLGGLTDRQNAPKGWDADVAFKVANHTSLVADISGASKSLADINDSTLGAVTPKIKVTNFLFGPRFSTTAGKVTPFAEALFGFARSTVGVSAVGVDANVSSNGFGMAFGGGLDVKASKNVSLRLAKFDYMLNRVSFSSTDLGISESETLKHFRFATGVVFNF